MHDKDMTRDIKLNGDTRRIALYFFNESDRYVTWYSAGPVALAKFRTGTRLWPCALQYCLDKKTGKEYVQTRVTRLNKHATVVAWNDAGFEDRITRSNGYTYSGPKNPEKVEA